MRRRVLRIISGGQTGVDRGALDAARDAGVPAAGWCPRGRIAEDGEIPPGYPLEETPCSDYEERTIWNVADADATLVLNRGRLSGGTLYTVDAAERLGRRLLIVDLDTLPDGGALEGAAVHVAEWVDSNGISTLNVAGPRESKSPGIAADTRAFVARVIAATLSPSPAS